jgi:hypothetical protein
MSAYGIDPIDFGALKTVPIAERGGKVGVPDFATIHQKGQGIVAWLDSLPKLLAADSLRAVGTAILAARASKRAVIWAIGGHVIKCGLAPVLLDLARRGFITAIAMNGSAAIHDFEIAIAGQTSEDVEAVLPDGRFGAAEETGRGMSEAIREAARDGIGMGEALGRKLAAIAQPQWTPYSVLHQAYSAGLPVTVHVAVGTDTPHTHPAVDAAAIGAATHYDFRLFCSIVTRLNDGGVFINAGSAVIMPEVFLKAVSAVRNLGHPLENFTTANFDFLQHYRPRVNVVERPHAQSGGRGYAITGHHEIMLPLLAALLIETSE